MNNIYKICIILAMFLAFASCAWAGFIYDSARNFYVLDSTLKIDGSYVLVGNALDSHMDSLVAANNIIMSDNAGIFTDSDNQKSREFGMAETGESYIQTKAITVNSDLGLRIFSSDSPLVISSDPDVLHLTASADLRFMKNLLIGAGSITSAEGYIYVPTISVENVKLLSSNALSIISGNQIIIKSSGDGKEASAENIFYGDEPFCYIADYSDAVKSNRDNTTEEGDYSRDKDVADENCTDLGADTTGAPKHAHRTCCKPGYYVFDIWEGGVWNPETEAYDIPVGNMVCCRYAESKLLMIN